MHLGELTWPYNTKLQDYRKVVMRSSVVVNPKSFQFLLPGHKADRFFEGNLIVIQSTDIADDACTAFGRYLSHHDRSFPFRAELWLKEDDHIPTRSWFLRCLRKHFSDNIGGQSLRVGGATELSEAGIPSYMIQAIGRWSSETFRIYIRQHPVLLAALLACLRSQLF